MKKWCPLRNRSCLKEECALWLENGYMCCIKAIAFSLTSLEDLADTICNAETKKEED